MKPIHYFIEYVTYNLFPLVEYSEGEIRYLVDKFKEEAEDFGIIISDEDLRKYIKRFDELKNSPNISQKDLRKTSLKQLLKIVRAKDTDKKDDDEEVQTPDVVYDEGGITVFNGSKHENCIHYGRGESWCITRQTNNWANYRYGVEEVTFYLVKDSNKPDENKDSFFVIHVLNNGKFRWTDRSNNPGMSEAMDWEDLTRRFPVIENLRGVFKYIPFSKQEKASQGWKNPIPFRDWVTNLDAGDKQTYIISRVKNRNYSAAKFFSDIENSTFFKKVSQYDKIAKWIVESPELFRDGLTLLSLLKAYDTFKPNYQKSLLNNLLKPTILPLGSDLYSWSLKKDLVRIGKLKKSKDLEMDNDDDSQELFYLFDENTIVQIKLIDNGIKLGLYLEDVDYPNVKINKRTAKYIANYPKDDIPMDILMSTIKRNGLDPKLFKLDLGGNIIPVDGKNISFNFKHLVAIDPETQDLIPLSNEKIKNVFVEEIKRNETLNQQVLKILIEPGAKFENRGLDYKDLIPLVKAMPKKDIKIEARAISPKSVAISADNDAIYIFKSILSDFDFKTEIIYNISSPNGAKEISLTDSAARAYKNYLIGAQKSFDDRNLIRIFERNTYEKYEAKMNFVRTEPPMAANSNYQAKIINERIFLVNRVDPANSKRIERRSGNVLTVRSANVVGGGAVAPVARPGVGRPAGRPAAVAPAAAPAAPAGAQTVSAILRGHDLTDATTSNALRALLNSPATIVPPHSDRGAARRDRIIQNGAVIQVLRVAQSAVYIIEFNNGHKIASVAIQPNALHFIIFEDRIEQIQRANELENVLRGLNLEEQKYIIKEFLLSRLKLI